MRNHERFRRWRPLLLAAALVGMGAMPAAAKEKNAAKAERDARLARVDDIVKMAILHGASPGAAVAIGHSDGTIHIRTYGRTDWAKDAPAVTDSTLYDLASLTKVLATTPAAMLLVQQGRLNLDAEIWHYLPFWPHTGDKGRITVRELLTHSAGFPAGENLERVDGGREARIRSIARRPLEYRPGEGTIYSDISMVVLGAIVEQISGQRLDRFVVDNLYRPLEMRDTRYTPLHPSEGSPFDLARIAPTERGGDGLLQGRVQDPTARALDGISGNAGLFSSIRDVAKFAELMLQAEYGEDSPVLGSPVIREFSERQPGAKRALGWDVTTPDGWGKYFSKASFGHTGYTGTSIWIDPKQDVFVVLLTNRVDPTAANQKHKALRLALNQAVHDDFALKPGQLQVASVATEDVGGALTAVSGAALDPLGEGKPNPVVVTVFLVLMGLMAGTGAVDRLRATRIRQLVAHRIERWRGRPPVE